MVWKEQKWLVFLLLSEAGSGGLRCWQVGLFGETALSYSSGLLGAQKCHVLMWQNVERKAREIPSVGSSSGQLVL